MDKQYSLLCLTPSDKLKKKSFITLAPGFKVERSTVEQNEESDKTFSNKLKLKSICPMSVEEVRMN
jgi:hypothetical protein